MLRSAALPDKSAAFETSTEDDAVLGLMYAGAARVNSELGYLVRLVTGNEAGNAGPTALVSRLKPKGPFLLHTEDLERNVIHKGHVCRHELRQIFACFGISEVIRR